MELFDLLEKAVNTFEQLGIPYLVTGAVASIAHGEPRLTNDIDVVADMSGRQAAALLAASSTDEFYISKEVVIEAIRSRGQFNMDDPDYQNTLKKFDMPNLYLNAEDAEKADRQDYERLGRLVQKLGLQAK